MRRFTLLIVIGLIMTTMLFTGCKTKTRTLYIFNWSDYIDPVLLQKFEKDNNCKVKYSTYDSNENMLTKIKSSRESFDVIFPSGDHVSILATANMLEELDHKKLNNFPNLDPTLVKMAESFDPGNKYSIPYFWGLTGLIYHKQNVPAAVMADSSWNIIANAHFAAKNKVTMLDDAREVVGAALISKGFDLNDTSAEALKAAEEVLAIWDKNITQYDSDSYKNEVPDGTTWLAQAYNGDALQQMAENPDLGFVLPKEGSSLWMDNMVILKSSTNKDLAYKFLDFLMDAENAKVNAEYTQYATPNKAAADMLDPSIKSNALIYPPKAYLDKCYMIKSLGDKIKAIDAAFEKIKMF